MIQFKAQRLVILLALFVGFGACKEGKGCGDKSEVPKTSMARVEQMTSKVPATSDTVFVISDLKEMRSAMNLLKQRLPADSGIVEPIQKQIQMQFGIDLLDAESWKRAGLVADSSAVGAINRSRLIVLLYVENRQSFEKVMVEKAKKAFQIEAVTKTEEVGKHKMKVLSDDPATQIAWMYQGKMALVSMPATDPRGSLEDGSATLVLAEVADANKEKSIWSHEAFQEFKSTLVENYPISVYLNTKESLDSDAVKKGVGDDPDAKAATDWARENVTFVGAALRAEGDQAQVKVHAGLTPGVAKKLQKAKKLQTKAEWSSFATEKLMLGLRLSINIEETYRMILEAMPDDSKRGLRRNLKMTGDQFSIDIEQDVLGQLAGHAGVFFYGIAGNPMAMAQAKGAAQIARQLGLLSVLKFKSADAVSDLLSKIVTNAGGAVTVRPFTNLPEDETFRVLSLTTPDSPGNFFIHGDTVVFATHAFGDEAMHEYLTDKRDDRALAEMEGLDLGKEFATGEGFNGLYFYPDRAQANLGSALAMGGVGQILAVIQEASLSLDAGDQGASALLTVDLKPAPEAEEKPSGSTDESGQTQ